MLCTPKSRILARSHAYLTVGQANLTVKMGCSHCEQCWEVERSVYGHLLLIFQRHLEL